MTSQSGSVTEGQAWPSPARTRASMNLHGQKGWATLTPQLSTTTPASKLREERVKQYHCFYAFGHHLGHTRSGVGVNPSQTAPTRVSSSAYRCSETFCSRFPCLTHAHHQRLGMKEWLRRLRHTVLCPAEEQLVIKHHTMRQHCKTSLLIDSIKDPVCKQGE